MIVPKEQDFFVSIIMPVYQEADCIALAINSVLANDWPGDRLEILVIDGGSTDGTRKIVRQFEEDTGIVKLLDNPGKIVPTAMNIGIKKSIADIIIRVDGHCEVPPTFVADSTRLLAAHPEAGCAGGIVDTIGTGYWGEAIALAMTSPFGVGGSRFRTGGYTGWVDTLAFGAYWRKILIDIGMFDERLVRNQDDELNLRLIRSGYKIYMDSSIVTKYFARTTLQKLWRQYYQYGFWKVAVIRKHKLPASIRHLVPATFVLAIMSAVFVFPISPWFLGGLVGCYGLAAVLAAVATVRRKNPKYFPALLPIFAILHISYGLGFLRGVLARKGTRLDSISR